jgi:hypothetical protein
MITLKNNKIKNKKAVSLIVSYVLLIVITLIIAGAVAAWLNFRANIPDQEQCPDGISLVLRDYSCNNTINEIELQVKNKGRFNINGFYLMATNNIDLPPTTSLPRSDLSDPIPGRYDFGTLATPTPLPPEQTESASFIYRQTQPLKKIQIQPFIIKDEKVTLCENIAQITLDDSKGCN